MSGVYWNFGTEQDKKITGDQMIEGWMMGKGNNKRRKRNWAYITSCCVEIIEGPYNTRMLNKVIRRITFLFDSILNDVILLFQWNVPRRGEGLSLVLLLSMNVDCDFPRNSSHSRVHHFMRAFLAVTNLAGTNPLVN